MSAHYKNKSYKRGSLPLLYFKKGWINDAQNQIDKMEKIKKEAKEELTPLNRVKEKLTAIQNELENTIQKKEVTNDNEETDRSLQRY